MITDIDMKNFTRTVAEFFNQHGVKVMEMYSIGFLPVEKNKSVLWQIVEEGGKTNHLWGNLGGHYSRKTTYSITEYYGLIDPEDIDQYIDDHISRYPEYDNE